MKKQGKSKQKEKPGKQSRTKPKLTKMEKTDRQIIFFLVLLAAILASFFAFSMLFNKPCFDYEGFNVCKVALQGTDIIFYSIPVKFTVEGVIEESNVVLRNSPKYIEKLDISMNVPDYFLKTRPLEVWFTMDPNASMKAVAAAYEVKKFCENLNIPTGFAYTRATNNNSVVKLCENATNSQRIVWFRQINITGEDMTSVSVSKDNPYCIIIESNSYDGLIEAADKLVIEWLLAITAKK